MKNLAKFLGIAALAAAMAFVMTACGPDDPGPPADAPEAIFFLSADYGAYPDFPISATIREFKPPEGGSLIDRPATAPYRSIDTATADILICWFQEDATEGLYAEFKKASDVGRDKNNAQDLLAPRVPKVVVDPSNPDDYVVKYESYLGTIDKAALTTTGGGKILDTASNNSTKGLLYKPEAGRYVAGIAVASKFKEWLAYQNEGTKLDDGTVPSLPKFLFSNTVVIASGTPGTPAEDFVGKWEMGYTFTPAGSGFTSGGYEVLKISKDTFRIFLSQKDEGIQFKISGWDKLPAGSDLLTRNIPKVDPATNKQVPNETVPKIFTEGYKLNVVEVLLNMGYTDYDEFYIYKDNVNSQVYLYRTNGQYNQGKKNDNPYTVVRYYSKRTPAASISITGPDAEDWTVTGEAAPAWKDPNAP